VARPRRRQPDLTRSELLRAARSRFGTAGYAATNTEDLVREVGLTRGALYHHFDSKMDLFRAVVELVVNDAVELVSTPRPVDGDQWDRVVDGMLLYLDLCLAPGNMQIIVIDAPALLGLSTVARIGEEALGGRWEATLRACMAAGQLAVLPVPALSHVLATAVSEASIFVAHAAHREQARSDAGEVLVRIMNGLRPPPR
jgi:AcrR family transcriptional regulator